MKKIIMLFAYVAFTSEISNAQQQILKNKLPKDSIKKSLIIARTPDPVLGQALHRSQQDFRLPVPPNPALFD